MNIVNQYQDGEYTVTEYDTGLIERKLPPAAEAPHVATAMTRLAFRNRFTPAEKIALYTAAESSVAIRVYLDDVNAATFIDPARADTIAGVQALEVAGIIATGRAAQILGAAITADEEWRGT